MQYFRNIAGTPKLTNWENHSYRPSIVTIPLSGLVSEIFSSEVSDRMTDRMNDRMNDRQTDAKVIIRVAKA